MRVWRKAAPIPATPETAADLLDAPLAGAGDEDSFLRALRTYVCTLAGCQRAATFVRGGAGEFVEISPDGPMRAVSFSACGTVARWLRVNSTLLRCTRDQIKEDLSDEELHVLTSYSARGIFPIASEGELFGFVLLCDEAAGWVPRGTDELWYEAARRTGWRWLRLRARIAAQEQSQEAHRSRQLYTAGQLAVSIAHEVRNPLAAIRSTLQFVANNATANASGILNNLISDIDRVDKTVSGFLNLSKPFHEDKQVVDLNSIASEAGQFIDAHARKLGIRIEVRCPGRLPVFVHDREVRQALLNLLLNACEACAETGVVAIATRSEIAEGARWALVEVTDNGTGISSADLPRVFEPFYTTKSSGSGLGLAVSRDVLARSGGQISITSEVNRGTTVSVRIPVSEADGQDPRS